MKTTWISRAVLVSLLSMSAALAGCGEVPRYDALSDDTDSSDTDSSTTTGSSSGGAGIDLVRDASGDRQSAQHPGSGGHTGSSAGAGAGTPGEPVLNCLLVSPSTNGAVRDTSLVEFDAQGHGQDGSAWTGHVSYAHAQMLLRFELSIPKEGKVRSAVVTLHHVGNGKDLVRVHRVTAPWSDDITWESFDGAYDPIVEAAFTNEQGARTFDIFALAQAWVDGSVENDGLLLEQDVEGSTQFRTSEWSDPSDRPTLEVCYEIAAQM